MFQLQRFLPVKMLGAAGLCGLLLTGCHSSAAQRAVSPIIGTWKINGPIPEPDANLPRFTQFTFRRDGSVSASYVAAGGALANVVKSSSQVREESDTYSLTGKHHLRIIEGSRSLDYHYDVRDGKLFVTPPGSDSATVYTHVHGEDGEDSESSSSTNSDDNSQ